MVDKKKEMDGMEYLDKNTSVNWYNSKGFYDLIDKVMALVTISSLEGDKFMWLKSLDRLARLTKYHWKNVSKFSEFEKGFNTVYRRLGNTSQGFTSQVMNDVNAFLEEEIRKLEDLVYQNISHLMLKSDVDDDDEDDWLRGEVD